MKKTIKKILAGGLALVCTVTACVTAIATNGFGIFAPKQTELNYHDNPFLLSNFFGNGITVTANADEASPVLSSVVSDAGSLSALTSVNMASVPFTYQDLTLYENQTVVKIGIPVKTITDYTTDSIFTVYLISYNEPLTTFTQVAEYKLTIPANTFSSNTVNQWYYFDTNIAVGENQTLGFSSANDSVFWGFLSSSKSQYVLYNKLFSGYGTSAYGFFDIHTDNATENQQSYTLKATVNEDATDKSVTWAIAWADGSTEDVNAYVSLEPTGTDGLSVIVRNIQAFDKQIIVKVTSNSNPEISAQCTLDYVKRLTDFQFSMGSDGQTIGLDDTDVAPTKFHVSSTYSKGTLSGTLTWDLQLKFSSEFISVLTGSDKYHKACIAESLTIPYNTGYTITFIDSSSNSYVNFMKVSDIFGRYTESVSGTLLHNAIHETANELEAEGKTIATVTATVTYTHSSGYTQTDVYTLDILNIDSSAKEIAVTNISLDNSSLIF